MKFLPCITSAFATNCTVTFIKINDNVILIYFAFSRNGTRENDTKSGKIKYLTHLSYSIKCNPNHNGRCHHSNDSTDSSSGAGTENQAPDSTELASYFFFAECLSTASWQRYALHKLPQKHPLLCYRTRPTSRTRARE